VRNKDEYCMNNERIRHLHASVAFGWYSHEESIG